MELSKKQPTYIKEKKTGFYAKFQWDDPLFFEQQLRDDEILIRDTAKTYAQNHLKPRVENGWRNEFFDPDIFPEMGKLGLLGPTLSEKYNGANTNYVSYGLAAQEIERIDSGYRSAMSVQSSLVIYPIEEYGTEEQKNNLLPELAKGKQIGCFGLTEPDFGSDIGNMKTYAKKIPAGYQISGEKTWITNAPIADIFIIWAKSEHHQNRIKGFIVEKNSKGLKTHKIKNKMSMRNSSTGAIILEDVVLSENAILPGADGLAGPFQCLNRARYGIGWGALGAAQACWQIAREYTLQRKQFEKPIAAKQIIQKKLADMQTEITLGMQVNLRIGRLIDEGNAAVEMISIAKRNNAGKALEIARNARDMLGANGIADEYHIIRHMLNLETVNTYEGTHDIHALILGRAQTGIQAFS